MFKRAGKHGFCAGAIVFSAHGVPPSFHRRALEQGLVEDAIRLLAPAPASGPFAVPEAAP